MNWLLLGIVGSGLSAVYFWKKANPGKSLNPTVGYDWPGTRQFSSVGFGKDADD